MKLFKRSVELIVIRDIFNPQKHESYSGHDVEKLLKQAFGRGLSENVRLYHGNLLDEVTPKTPQDVDKVMRLNGRIYAVVKPMGLTPVDWIIIGISALVSVATAFLMPIPAMAGSQNQPPSPNNALAARTNKQRLGGRIPDIYGTVWSVPDLIAQTYSIYVDGKEIEYSYYCVGRGNFNVTEALDDTTPIRYVRGSSVLIYNANDGLDDEPAFVFGEQFNPNEAEFARLSTKRYTSVNGQDLSYPDSYDILPTTFRAPNIIETSETFNFTDKYSAGETINIEGAEELKSGNGVTITITNDDETATEIPVIYNLVGQYEIESVTADQIILKNPATVNGDWQTLANNADFTVEVDATISTEAETLWQGYFYTENREHNAAYVNIIAPNGLYATSKSGNIYGRRVEGVIESELVDASGNAVGGTFFSEGFFIQAPSMSVGVEVNDDNHRKTAANTVKITNPYFVKGTRLRYRIARTTPKLYKKDGSVVQDIKIKDFYSYRVMTAADYPKGVTTVYGKTQATEGALSLKERKLRLLVQRYVVDATTGLPKLSNRVDDIIRHIATDPKIGNLDMSQVDMGQIKDEVDNIVAYFGTEKCAEFCGTFDDNNLSSEEIIQTVARAAFSQAKRQGNKVMLDFERLVPASGVVFNSHNILPDTFSAPQSFGVNGDFDGVKVEWTDPVDDAVVTLNYPDELAVNPHEEKLIGVRNKVQAHIHAMRILNRDLHVYKSCEFTAGDESNIVVRTNRITVADQLRADVQQGSVDSIEVIDGKIIMQTSDPVVIDDSKDNHLFIQTINNGVESIPIVAHGDYSVRLLRLPSGEISNGYDAVVQAVYQIVETQSNVNDAYIITEKSPSEGMTNTITCTNYSDCFYQNDSDYKDGKIEDIT